jgi:hypothetical protein
MYYIIESPIYGWPKYINFVMELINCEAKNNSKLKQNTQDDPSENLLAWQD